MRISEATFVVVDTETTGTRAGADRLIEVAAVRMRGGVIVDRFGSLINPGRAVPRRITELTGISTAMLVGAPSTEEVLDRLLDFLGDAVLVAHNAPFDAGFINAELERHGRPTLENDTLCTLRLARRLLPGLKSKGLSSVSDFYKVSIEGRHRAAGDAEATAAILGRFLDHLAMEHGLTLVKEVLRFQNRSYRALKKSSKALQRIREHMLPSLPDRPGVYFMKDGRGTIIYIGKARSLRNRVRSYFNAIEAHPPRIRQLVDAVRTIAWEETGSELGALLLESKLIKEHQPRFNRAQRQYRSRPFIRLDTRHPYPRISWIPYVLNDGAEYFGPVAGRRQAELVVELIDRFFQLRECEDDLFAKGRHCMYAEIGRCGAPCEGKTSREAYAAEVQRVRDFLEGRDRSLLRLLEQEMKAAAARLEFEEAGQYRDWMRRLEVLLDRQRGIAAPVLAHNAVLVHAGTEPGTVQLFLIRFGRFAESVTVGRPPARDDLDRLRDRLAHHFDPERDEPERYFKQEIDEIRLLTHWMYVHRSATRHVSWMPDRSLDALVEDVVAAVSET